jgi:sulfopyruvate decarboxylase subunit beta
VSALHGRAIIEALVAARIEFVAALPDIVTSDGLLWPLARLDRIRLIRVCKEDEGVSICAGLSFCDKRALLLMQNTGFFDSINAIRGIGVGYERPICMMIGLQGKSDAERPAQSAKLGVSAVEPILDVLGIARHLIDSDADAAAIPGAVDRAYAASAPVAFVLNRSPAP